MNIPATRCVLILAILLSIVYGGQGCDDGEVLPYPCDCTLFYECHDGHMALGQYPPGYGWNPRGHACEFRWFIHECDGYNADSEDDSKFYRCSKLDCEDISCSYGTVLNPTTGGCDWLLSVLESKGQKG